MKRPDPTQPIPPTLTAAAILAIELAASEQYGLRLRHVPLEEEDDQGELEKPQAKTKKPSKIPVQKDSKPPDNRELRKLILTKVSKASKVQAKDFYSLWPNAKKNTAKGRVGDVLRELVNEGHLTKDGKGTGTSYRRREKNSED